MAAPRFPGGRGDIKGTLLGAFVIGFLSDGLVIIGISSYWQTVFTGAVIVLAVLLNAHSVQASHQAARHDGRGLQFRMSQAIRRP